MLEISPENVSDILNNKNITLSVFEKILAFKIASMPDLYKDIRPRDRDKLELEMLIGRINELEKDEADIRIEINQYLKISNQLCNQHADLNSDKSFSKPERTNLSNSIFKNLVNCKSQELSCYVRFNEIHLELQILESRKIELENRIKRSNL